MNHECLAALLYSIRSGCDSISDILVKPEYRDFLHPGELELLRRVVNIAKEYHRLVEYINNVQTKRLQAAANIYVPQPKPKNDGHTEDAASHQVPVQNSIYLIAFCSGLSKVLEEYSRDICFLENTFLKNKQLSLPYVLGALEKYITLFNTLNAIIVAIEMEHVHGCLLIGRLHKYIDCGIEPVEKFTRVIVLSVNKVFYSQLANWIIFGNIGDMNKEFFIADCNLDDEDFLFDWEINRGGGGEESPHQEKEHVHKRSRLRSSYKVRKFIIRANLVPNVMPFESAETILFMGRMVWILQRDPLAKGTGGQMAPCNKIWSNRTMEHIAEIQSMETEPFDRSRFEKKMEMYRITLTKYLWQVMVNEANLLEHLQMIRDYYCLGRGELFQHFIIASKDQLIDIPGHYLIKNLNYIFIDTARKIYSNDMSYTKFELAIPYGMSSEDFAQNPMGNMEMYFEVKWPLHIIFQPKVMVLLNKVFGFLMRVKKTHIDLNHLWLKHVDLKKVHHVVWSLRHNLIFLVNNLQYYLQVDIIEAQFSILIESIKDANEYSDIVRMHSMFISNLLSRTFIIALTDADRNKFNLLQMKSLDLEMKPKVYNIIICLLELCDNFCLVAHEWHANLLSTEKRQLEKIQQNLDTILENLFRALLSLHEKVSGPHLLQLLHRLDFNRWFTKNKPDLNLSVV